MIIKTPSLILIYFFLLLTAHSAYATNKSDTVKNLSAGSNDSITSKKEITKEIVLIPLQRREEIINILKQDCGSCHGMTLQGGLGPSLLPDALEIMTQEQVALTISAGRPGTPMPPWKPFFSKQEMQWLAKQLKQGITHKDTDNKSRTLK